MKEKNSRIKVDDQTIQNLQKELTQTKENLQKALDNLSMIGEKLEIIEKELGLRTTLIVIGEILRNIPKKHLIRF